MLLTDTVVLYFVSNTRTAGPSPLLYRWAHNRLEYLSCAVDLNDLRLRGVSEGRTTQPITSEQAELVLTLPEQEYGQWCRSVGRRMCVVSSTGVANVID